MRPHQKSMLNTDINAVPINNRKLTSVTCKRKNKVHPPQYQVHGAHQDRSLRSLLHSSDHRRGRFAD